MTDSCVKLTLDVRMNGTSAVVSAKKGDTARVLQIALADGGKPYPIGKDCYAMFAAEKPDGTKILNRCIIQGDQILYPFTVQTCAAPGSMPAEIKLYGAEDKLLTSARFLLEVQDTVFSEGDVIASEDEMNALDALILETAAMKAELEEKLETGAFVGPVGPQGPQGIQGEKGEKGDPGVVFFDPAAYGLPMLALTGDVSAMSKDNAVTLNYVYGDRSGTCTVKWQGNSSLAYPKKNYTIKFDQEFEAFEGWGAQKKYCLKADFIDFSHARNVVSAKLWGQIVRSRSGGTIVQIKDLPNGGAVDGFPCVVTINGEFTGVYNFNIPKDGWMFGMGAGQQEAIVCAENYAFDKTVVVDGTDLELEYVSDESNAAWVTESLNRLVTAVLNSDGTDIDTTIAQYLDIDSAIDYLIFTAMNMGNDNTTKNAILATYDGVKWFFSAYDMDGTWGLKWNGKEFYSAAINSAVPAGSLLGFARTHGLMKLLYTHKFEDIQNRYWELRSGTLSIENVEKMFTNYASSIHKTLLAEDARLWPTIPSTETNDISQIINWYQNRCAAMDENVGEKETVGVTYKPEIDGFIRTGGTISTSANYKRTDYIPLDGFVEAEYLTFVVYNESATSAMSTWALFDADKKWIASSDDVFKKEYCFPLYGSGNLSNYGLLRKTISITELLETYPNANYIVLSTNNTSVYEASRNQDNMDVGWGSEAQYITLRGISGGVIEDENGTVNTPPPDAVLYVAQDLTPEQQEQARKNIGVTGTGKDGESPVITLSDFSDSTGTGVNIEVKNADGTGANYPVYNGKNGTSALASVSKSGNVTTITTQDASGTKTAEVYDGKDGTDGKDAVSPTLTVSKSGKVTTVTIKDANGTKTATINDGTDGKDGETGQNGEAGPQGDPGPAGQRGTGILNTTTGIAAYTTAVGGVSPKYRILLSKLKTEAKVSEVLVGDTVRYSTFLYPVIYIDAEYAYLTTRVSIQGNKGDTGATGPQGETGPQGPKGDTGATGPQGPAYTLTSTDKTTIVNSVLAALPTWTGGSY